MVGRKKSASKPATPKPTWQIHCLLCDDLVHSAHRHDYHPRKCGSVAIDGGNDYLRVAYDASSRYKLYRHGVLMDRPTPTKAADSDS